MTKEDNQKAQQGITYVIMIFLFVIGIGVGILVKSFFPTSSSPYTQIRDDGYEYINPLVDFESVKSAGNDELSNLQNSLDTYVNEKLNEDITNISIYYKDLNSGAWIGINEDEKFSPASLLKVVDLILIYKLSENNPNLLTQKVTYTPSKISLTQEVKPENTLIEGEKYTLDELVNQLILYSDNAVIETIQSYISYHLEDEIFDDLGISNPYLSESTNSMSVKEYASFFRILYNASYLNKEMSTKALKLLSQTTYDKGIEKGVPDDITIANKFGERELIDAENEYKYQFHDCGIIYHPEKPYLLCVMTRGTSFEVLQGSISGISKIVFNIVNK